MSISMRYLISLGLMIACGCGKSSSFEGQKKEATAEGATGVPGAGGTGSTNSPDEAEKPIVPATVGDRPIETVLCQDGYKLLKLIEKTSLNEDFGLACTPDKTTILFQELITKAYAGAGDPNVKLVQFKVGDLFVTRMIVAYAMKVPLNDPSLFYSLKAHDVLTTGIQEKNSEVVGLVESRRNFPGRRSVEEIILNYSLNKSEGAGLFDKRRTEFNTYLLSETSTDVVVATEELLNPEINKTYHDYKGLLLGLRAEPGYTYLVFINDFTIKNRIDPLRLQRTLIALSQGMQKKMYNFFVSKGTTK